MVYVNQQFWKMKKTENIPVLSFDTSSTKFSISDHGKHCRGRGSRHDLGPECFSAAQVVPILQSLQNQFHLNKFYNLSSLSRPSISLFAKVLSTFKEQKCFHKCTTCNHPIHPPQYVTLYICCDYYKGGEVQSYQGATCHKKVFGKR